MKNDDSGKGAGGDENDPFEPPPGYPGDDEGADDQKLGFPGAGGPGGLTPPYPGLNTLRIGRSFLQPTYPGTYPQAMKQLFSLQDVGVDPSRGHSLKFSDSESLQKLAENLGTRESEFHQESASTRPVHARTLAEEAPRETSVSVLGKTADVAKALDQATREIFDAAGVRLDATRLEVLALTGETTVRLDLAEAPAHTEDVLFVTAFDASGRGEAMLRSLRSDGGYIAFPLNTGRAVLVPARNPADLTDIRTAGSSFGDRLFVVAALVRLTSREA